MNLSGLKERQSKKKLLGLINRSYGGESNDKLQAQQVISTGIEAHICLCVADLGMCLKMTEIF